MNKTRNNSKDKKFKMEAKCKKKKKKINKSRNYKENSLKEKKINSIEKKLNHKKLKNTEFLKENSDTEDEQNSILEEFYNKNDLSDTSSNDSIKKYEDCILNNDDNENEAKLINIEYVNKYLNSINKKTRLNKLVKLLSFYKDALDLFNVDEVDSELPKIETPNKIQKKKKKIKKKRNKYSMNLDTSLFIVFNVLYNINTLFYNITNDGNLKMKIWKIESIKKNELFEDKQENIKNNNLSSDNYDLENIYKYKNIQKYKPIIVYFFKTLLLKIKNLNNNDLLLGILKIIKNKEILRWIIIFSYGKQFLKKICKFFIISKNNDAYFFLFILIQNMFQLYNEKKRTIFNNLSKSEYEEENEIKKTFDMEKTIFEIYQSFFQSYLIHYGTNYNITHLNHMNFKENCLIELFTYLSHDVAYIIAFRYIQIIIQKIREQFKTFYEEKKTNKKKDDQKKVSKNIMNLKKFHLHSSYMILLIRFLTKIINLCDNLDILTYGITILIISILKTKINNMKFIPINLQFINILIRIMENKKKYIPLFSYFSCILNGLKSYKHIRSVSKNQAVRMSIENFDINTSIEIDEKLINDFSIPHQIYDKIYVLLYDYIGLMANHVSFPEFFVVIESYLKKYYSECEIYVFKSRIKNLLVQAKSSIDIILNKRKNINIYNVHDKMTHFQNENFPLSSQRLIVLQNYENNYLKKIEARLSGINNIKNNEEENSEIEKINDKKKNKKSIKKKREALKAVDDGNRKKIKKIKDSMILSNNDNLEDFSLSSEEEST
ncbi:conserved Plasmodium protein, unknown function [Plasmodium gallinaceum]|uniref:Nucleolar complex protein 2 n=1 Tax=Plasmodium gallinaceum TaxID=5849 RepID=A0A1J1GRF0_PLAGA|nr:conserved Plasmodium protein, unknown function [Plasmodium gallinaceum]CRG95111.1 conserved Plasmodium protein, unknown function [Plasmodium gallinaceum]